MDLAVETNIKEDLEKVLAVFRSTAEERLPDDNEESKEGPTN